MNASIIVAAGRGERFGSEKAKQFLEVCGKPVIAHTLERFENCSAVDEIILVLRKEEIENFSTICEKYKVRKLVKIVSGGETRAVSVFNGLEAIDAKRCEIVTVHDGARPFVSSEEIKKTIETAKETGAACLVAQVTDTIKEVSSGKILQTIDRAKLRRALTPQSFRFEILKTAFAENNFCKEATDECFLVEKLGLEIEVVEGSAKNIKITHAQDLALAESLLKQFKI